MIGSFAPQHGQSDRVGDCLIAAIPAPLEHSHFWGGFLLDAFG